MMLPACRNDTRCRLLAVIGILCSAGFAGTAQAQIPALSFDASGGTTAINGNQMVGWQFDVLSTIAVTGLGWYDDGANGLAEAHRVGIWNPAGTLLAEVTVPAGVTAGLVGQFRTVAITPLALAPASGYIVGGLNSGTNPERVASNVAQTTIPQIDYVDATFSVIGSGFTRPTNFSSAVTGFYGPSFSVGVAPEPASFALGILGLSALLIARRRR